MKRRSLFVLLLLVLSAIAGYLLSKASFVGRAGISLFYRQYSFLKTWWQGGLLVFIVWMLLFFLHAWLQKKLPPKTYKLVRLGFIAMAIVGLYATYRDFRYNLSHRWLGERFHLGGYLFWIGWLIIGVYFLTEKKATTSFSSLPRENDPSSHH